MAEGSAYRIHGSDCLRKAVHSYGNRALPVRKCHLGKPFRNTYFSRNPGLMQFHACSGELFHSLDEISRIGPEPCMVKCNDHVARLTGEAAHPFHLLPA